jgi:uncharacterized protein
MIIDSHTSVPPDWLLPLLGDRQKFFERATIPNLLTSLRKAGVDKAILFSIARKPEHVTRINDFIAEECGKHPDELVGFANIYPPNLKDALAEIDRAVGELGLAGLKIHPLVQNFRLDHPNVPLVLERAKEYSLPIIIHVASAVTKNILNGEVFEEAQALELQEKADEKESNAKSAYLAKVVDHYNHRMLYAAHLGGITIKEIQDSKISFQTPGATVQGIEYAVKTVGADRITFGSDFPLLEVKDELDKVKKANITDIDKRKILGENLRIVLKI